MSLMMHKKYCRSYLIKRVLLLGVGFTPEHSVTIEAGQNDPNGPPELSIPDGSLSGKPIKIEKSCGSRKAQ